jgi:glycosyltransferase involved in cell wall biosynthesis
MPGTMPSKMYEALASSVPVLVAKGCEGEALVREFHVGKTFEPLDAEELAASIEQLVDHPQEIERIRAHCVTLAPRYDREVIVSRTDDILRAVASGQPLPKVVW